MAWLALPFTAVLIATSLAAWPHKYLVAAQQSDLQSPPSSNLLSQVFASQSDLVSQSLVYCLGLHHYHSMLHAESQLLLCARAGFMGCIGSSWKCITGFTEQN